MNSTLLVNIIYEMNYINNLDSYRVELLKLFLIDSLEIEWGQISPRHFKLNYIFQIGWFFIFFSSVKSDTLKATKIFKE